MKRIVVTGLGVVCSIGNNLDEVWNNAINGVCGIKKIDSFDTQACSAKIGAEAKKFTPTFKNARHYSKKMDRVSLLCIEAVNEAIGNSGISINSENAERVGVAIGSCTGGVLSYEEIQKQLIFKAKRINTACILRGPLSTIAGNVAYINGIEGPIANIANACAAGTISIAYACNLIENNKADVVIAGGSDSIGALPFSGFNALQALDVSPCSPFSRSKGISLGEGAAALIIESYEHAVKRNTKILCEIRGYGISSDAHHITAPKPDGEGQITAMREAIQDAGVRTSDIDYINAHGTGTPLNDSAEAASLANVFEECIDRISVSSTKSMVGHCLGAAGAIESVLTIKAMGENIIPPTINFTESASAHVDFVPNVMKKKEVTTSMSNSFAFGGNNASIIYSKKTREQNVEKNNNKRVFITGIGIVSPIGVGIEEYWQNAIAGVRGMNGLTFEDDKYKSKVACNVKIDDFSKYGISAGALRKMDRLTKLLLVSGVLSFEDARLQMTDEDGKKTGILVGTSDGPITDIASFQEGIIKDGLNAGSALLFPNTVFNVAAGHFSILKKIKGYTATMANGNLSGISSACYGFDLIRNGRQEMVLAAGVDEHSESVHLGYDFLNVLAGENDELQTPYNFKHNRFVIGEGSTSFLLESQENALRRGAKLYAEIIGYGMANTPLKAGKIDMYARGMEKAIINACESANVKIEDIDAIVGFANGSKLVDQLELSTYCKVFGDRISEIPLHTVKSLVGESRAAASALQIAHAALLLDRNEAPVTRGGNQTSFEFQGKKVMLTEKASNPIKTILVTSFSFGGGYNAVLLKSAKKSM